MLPLMFLQRPRGVSPAVAATAPLIGATAVAPAPLASVPGLLMLTPVVRVIVEVPWEAGMGLAGSQVLESSSLISSKGPADKESAYRHSSRGNPLRPESEE